MKPSKTSIRIHSIINSANDIQHSISMTMEAIIICWLGHNLIEGVGAYVNWNFADYRALFDCPNPPPHGIPAND